MTSISTGCTPFHGITFLMDVDQCSTCFSLFIHRSCDDVPMEEARGSTLRGYIDGGLEGSARLVPGSALYIDGQQGSRVGYGVHTHGCFFKPDQCNQGLTFSVWLMLKERLSAYELIIDNGGCRPKGVGYCLYVTSDNAIRVTTMKENGSYTRYIPIPAVFEWHLFIITSIKGQIKMYIDGCDVEPYSNAYNRPRSDPHTEDSQFHFGDWSATGGKAAHFVLDELMVWY